MAFTISGLTVGSIEDAIAYWLYPEDEGFELWRLVPGSQTLSPDGRALRLAFDLDGDRFELALLQRGADLCAKFDDRDHPERELRVRVFESGSDVIVTFTHGDETVFVLLELAD